MRISDWSSDVCSSDLFCMSPSSFCSSSPRSDDASFTPQALPIRCCDADTPRRIFPVPGTRRSFRAGRGALQRVATHAFGRHRHARSEEHTSELQSLMRISYAVFCLKKKKKHTTSKTYTLSNRPKLTHIYTQQ